MNQGLHIGCPFIILLLMIRRVVVWVDFNFFIIDDEGNFHHMIHHWLRLKSNLNSINR